MSVQPHLQASIIRMRSVVVPARKKVAQGYEPTKSIPFNWEFLVCKLCVWPHPPTSKSFAMAAEQQNSNPIIVEPEASSHPGTPARLLAPSLNTSSSSSSFDSSRSQSRGSGATTPSESPSPFSTGVEPYRLANIRPAVPPDVEPLPPPTNPFLSNEGIRTLTSSTNGPLGRAEGFRYSNGRTSLSTYFPVFFNRRWLEHSLGVFGLVASLVGLLFVGVRTYKLAVISTQNSTLDGCTGLIQVSDGNNPFDIVLTRIQAGFVTLENSTQLCKTIMKIGPLSSPYHLGKRKLYSSLVLASKWMSGSPEQTSSSVYIGCQPQFSNLTDRNILTPTIVISTTLGFLGGLVFMLARRNARSMEAFTSPAYSDIQLTHHKDTGPETVTGQGIIERHDSKDHPLGEIHKRARASQDQDSLMKDTARWQSTDISSATLVDGCGEPRVSLEDHSSGEKHDGLIELQMNGHTKGFFKFETGELFHLKHWKHKYKDASKFSHHKGNSLRVEGEVFA